MNMSRSTRWIYSVGASVALSSMMMMGGGGVNAAAVRSVTVPLPAMSTLDPVANSPSILLDQGVILEGLYGYTLNNKLEGKMATGYTVSDGGKVWTFTLRKNARWSNGAPVTAQDFYYAWMRIASPKDSQGAVWQSVMTYVQGEYQYHAGTLPAKDVGVKVLSPYKIQLTLSAPHDILGILASAGSMPVYPPVVKAHPNSWWMPKYFVGNGPFKPKSFVVNGKISLVRNYKYVGRSGQHDVGNVQQINIIPAPTVPVEDYLSHALDLAWITNPSDYRYILKSPTLRSQVHKAPAYQMTYLEWDRSPTASPLDSLKVRQAIAMAVNRAPIVKDVLYGMGGAATAAGPSSWAPTKYEHALPYNVAQARKLLTEAGYPGGKGIPQLALYTQTVAANPAQVSVAEALASELKQALGINFKIEPTSTNIVNNVVYNGLEPSIAPGYVLGGGNAGWIDASYLPLQTNQLVHYNGALGSLKFRQYAEDWYFDTYDARDVKAFGNPQDAAMGVKLSQWAPLKAAALRDIAYLKAYTARQPKWYQAMVKPAPGQSNIDVWNGLIQDWKNAKTPAAKHSVWVTAWKFVGSGSLGNGNAEIGLNAQVYTDEHQGPILYRLNMEDAQLGEATSANTSNHLTANIVNTIFQQGWEVPLFYGVNIYLARPDITKVDANPFGWTGWGNLQYLQMK